MKKPSLAVIVAVLIFGAVASATHAGEYAPDNSGTNVRDRDPAAITAGDQSNSNDDLAITQEIRKSVVADESLSTNAHNVKIITGNGVVTLRGPVSSADEKARIAAKAQRVPGVRRVNNELEIAND